MRNGFLGWMRRVAGDWRVLLWVGLFLAALAGALELLQPWKTEWITAPDGRLWRNTVFEQEREWHDLLDVLWTAAAFVFCCGLGLWMVEAQAWTRLVAWAQRRQGNPPPYVGGYGEADRATELAARCSSQEPYQGWKYWCLVLLAVLLLGAAGVAPMFLGTGRTLWVDSVYGSDAGGVRGVASRPWATITAAVTNAVAGDVVTVLPGQYNCGTNNILRLGVNYKFSEGAVTTYTNLNASVAAGFQGLFDDRGTGPTTNWITGKGRFICWGGWSSVHKGMVVVTNALSEMHFDFSRIEVQNGLTAFANVPFAAFGLYSGKSFIKGDEIVDNGVEIVDDILTPTNVPCAMGVYWEQGQHHVEVKRIVTAYSYAMWGNEPTNNSAGDFWFSGDLVRSTNGVGIYVLSSQSVASPNLVSWLHVKELKASSIGLSLLGLNKAYVFADKISAQLAISSSSYAWVVAEKVTGLPQALDIQGGENYLNVQQWQQGASAAAPFMRIAGGVNLLSGGYALVTNGSCLKVTAGTNTVQGMTLETTLAGVNFPVNVTTNNLKLINVTLKAGSTNVIFATNAQTITVEGVLTETGGTNNFFIKLSGGMVVQNGRPRWQRPLQHVPSPTAGRWAYMVNNGAAATFTAVGDSANLVTAGGCYSAPADPTNGPAVVIATTAAQFNVNGVSGNLNYVAGHNCYTSTRAGLTNVLVAGIWWYALTDQAITAAVLTNTPAGSGAGFRRSTTAPDVNFKFVTWTGGAATATDTGVVIDTASHEFEIVEESLESKWYGYIDTICVATNSANLPPVNTLMRYIEGVQTFVTSTNAVRCEYVYVTAKP